MLTDKAVKAAKPSPGNRYRKLADQGGLYLFCTVDGTRSWRYDYRLAGQRKTFCIGNYPGVSLAEAREHHSDARKLVGVGQCPVLIKRRKRQAAILGAENTVKAIAEAWYAELAPHKSNSWRDGHRRRLDKYILPAMGHLPITDIEAADVLALVKGIKFPKTAEYVRQILARVFSFAIRSSSGEIRTKNHSHLGASIDINGYGTHQDSTSIVIGPSGDSLDFTYIRQEVGCGTIANTFGGTVYQGATINPCTLEVSNKTAGGWLVTTTQAPEIDPASAASGLTLLLGGLAVLRGRRKLEP
jgi:hypothetical protein